MVEILLGYGKFVIQKEKNKLTDKLTDSEIENILKLFYEGLTKSQIADKLGYSKCKTDSAFMSGRGLKGHRRGIRYRSVHKKGYSHKKNNDLKDRLNR